MERIGNELLHVVAFAAHGRKKVQTIKASSRLASAASVKLGRSNHALLSREVYGQTRD